MFIYLLYIKRTAFQNPSHDIVFCGLIGDPNGNNSCHFFFIIDVQFFIFFKTIKQKKLLLCIGMKLKNSDLRANTMHMLWGLLWGAESESEAFQKVSMSTHTHKSCMTVCSVSKVSYQLTIYNSFIRALHMQRFKMIT